MANCVELLATCTIPRMATRDGLTGSTAYLNLVGLGIWYASGQQLAFPSSEMAQDQSLTYTGTVKPNTFTKGFPCNVQAACPA